MRNKYWKRFFILLGVMISCLIAFFLYDKGRPVPLPVKRTLFSGVEYERMVRYSPRNVIIHIIKIDTKIKGLSFIVTPPDDLSSDHPILARTTSQFLDEFDVQIAVNGDVFSPWWSRSPLDYYPHAGDPVAVRGDAFSLGVRYSWEEKIRPTLYISSKNKLSFTEPGNPYNAISGESMLVMAGEIVTDREDPVAHPRTMIGYSKNERYLYLVVVDGRQPFYSEGLDLNDSAQLMIDIGAYFAMNMDGGGSSTMVIEGKNGAPVLLNSPIDNYIPGRERPVANHLGVYVNP